MDARSIDHADWWLGVLSAIFDLLGFLYGDELPVIRLEAP